MRKLSALALATAVSFATVGCYKHTYTFGKGGKVEVRRMTATAIRLCCARRAEEAGVESFSPNDLRRSSVSTRTKGRAHKAAPPIDSADERSLLYSGREDSTGAKTGHVHFPYRTRHLELL